MRSIRHRHAPRVVFFALLAASAFGRASESPYVASTSRESREEIKRTIPFSDMHPVVRDKLLDVVENPSIYRRLPVVVTDCDQEMYTCMVRHPELVVNMWQLMGITNVQVKRTGDYTLDADDGAGTLSKIELVYGTPNQHILYCEGAYEGPLLKRRIKGRCVLVLTSKFEPDDMQRTQATSRLDIFLRVDNAGAELVARTLHPLVGKTADTNFTESNRFISEVSRAAEDKWQKMQQMLPRLTNVEPEVLRKFAIISAKAHQRSVERSSAEIPTTLSSRSSVIAAPPTPNVSLNLRD